MLSRVAAYFGTGVGDVVRGAFPAADIAFANITQV